MLIDDANDLDAELLLKLLREKHLTVSDWFKVFACFAASGVGLFVLALAAKLPLPQGKVGLIALGGGTLAVSGGFGVLKIVAGLERVQASAAQFGGIEISFA